MNKEKCGAWMPRAKVRCAKGAGHKGQHSSVAALERAAVSTAVWRAANKEHLADYRAANREQIAASFAAWRIANPEKVRAYSAVRQARKAGLPATLTAAEWQQIRADHDDCCYYCDYPLDNGCHQDHVVPLSQGGGYTAENIVPACQPCNHQKHARTPEQWIGRAA